MKASSGSLFVYFLAALFLVGLARTGAAMVAGESSTTAGSLALEYAGTARTKALANATVADSDGLGWIYDNPAGLSLEQKYEVGLLYLSLFENANYSFIGYIHPLRQHGSVGFGWARLSSSNLEIRDAANVLQGTFTDAQNVFYAGYGELLSPALAVGANLKAFYNSQGTTPATGFGLDAGARYQALDNLVAGVNVLNLVSIPIQSPDIREPLPLVIRGGASWRPNSALAWLNPLTVDAEYDLVDVWGSQGGIGQHADYWKASLEYKLYETVAVRGGIKNNNLSAGFGLDLAPAHLDYAYDVHALGGLHWVSLAVDLSHRVDREQINQYYQAAMTSYAQGDYAASAANWDRVLALDPNDPAARQYRQEVNQQRTAKRDEEVQAAQAAEQTGDLDLTLLKLKKALELDPDNSDLKLKITRIQLELEERAKQEMAKTIQAHADQAVGYYQANDLLRALEEWQTVLALDPAFTPAQDAVKSIQAQLATHLDQHFYEGIQYFNQRRYPEAQKEFRLVLNSKPDYHLAKFYYDKVQEILASGLQRNYLAGLQHFQNRDYAQALASFQKVLDVVPAYKNILAYREQASARLAALAKTESIVQTAQRHFNGANPTAAVNVLAPLIQSDNYTTPMLRLYNRARQAKARAAETYQAGIKVYSENRFEEAIAAFRRSLALDAASGAQGVLAEAYTKQGTLFYRQNKLPEAIDAWRKVLAYAGDHTMVRRYIQRAENKQKFLKELFKEGEGQ